MTGATWRNGTIVAALLVVGLCGPAAAQGRPNRPRVGPGPAPLGEGGVSPAEVQQLFDAYVVMQAQQALELSDEQYPKFLARVKSLQDVRRRGQAERMRILQDLRRLTQGAEADQSRMAAQLKALSAVEVRVANASRVALEQVDEVLDVRQQARFRLFEEQMERRKVDLLLRARQANRPKPQF